MYTQKKKNGPKPQRSKITKAKIEPIKEEPKTFRWGESYTSLLLGIIVVIIGILFFASLAKTRNSKQVTSIATNIITATEVPLRISPTLSPAATEKIIQAQSITIAPTFKPSATPTSIPTPTIKPTNTPRPTPTMKPSPTPEPSNTLTPGLQGKNSTTNQQTYIVMAGDDLWHIAEKFYKSGYNYVDIAKANNLENPGILYSGTKLVIPQVTLEIATVQASITQAPVPSQAISQLQNNGTANETIKSDTYAIQKGDDLWNIAVRAYGDGYKWSDIAKANNLTDPNLIYSGNTLKIPR